MSTVSLADVKSHLQMTTTVNDTEVQRFIDAAEAAIANRVGPLTATSTTEIHDGGCSSLVLRKPRAVSLTSIAYADGSTSTFADYDLDTATGIIYWHYATAGFFPGGRRNVTVVYSAGWSSLPVDVVHAVKELVRHLWETQRPNKSNRRTGVDEPISVGDHTSWPPRVQELLEPYIVPMVG